MQNNLQNTIGTEVGNWLTIWSTISTLATLILFIGITVWVMSKKRNKDFDEASKIPLD